MADHPFVALLDLIEFDQGMRKTKQTIKELEDEIGALLTQQEQANVALDAAKQRVKALHKEVSDYELKIKVIDEKETERKKQLDELSEYRDYRSIKTEIDTLQRDRLDIEDALLSVLNKLESAQRDFEIQEAAHSEKVSQLTDSIEQDRAKVVEHQTSLQGRETERLAKEELVPTEWRDKYTTMRMRVPDPVVPMLDGGCSACFHSMTSQEMIRLSNKALVQCQGCFRLVYSQEVMVAAQQEKTA